MEIVVIVLGLVGFVMSWVIVGIFPACLAIILGSFRLMMKKKPLRKLGKAELIAGMIIAALAIGVGIYMYLTGIMDVDFVKLFRQWITDITPSFLKKE